MEILTPCKIETHEQIDIQFVRIDYVNMGNIYSIFLVKSFQSRNTELLVRAFKTYVRPLLEVILLVWSPHLLKDIRRLEAVQPRFTKS